MKFVTAILVALLTATASQAEQGEISVGGGQAKVLPGTQTTVRVTAVQDVRCPSMVSCVWEGTIRVDLEVTGPGKAPVSIVLCNACPDGGRTGDAGDVTLTLLRLEPGRDLLDVFSRPVVLQDYTVILAATPK